MSEGEHINKALRMHLGAVDDWRHADLIRLLHHWAEQFDTEFVLAVETPVIRLEPLRRGALGAYRRGRNGFGLLHEIAFHVDHLERPLAHLLVTLLHEMLHEWQEIHGKSSSGTYHNAEFRKKAQQLGLLIDQRGRSEGVRPDSPFIELLEQHGVDTSVFFTPKEPKLWPKRKRGQSKMKKFSCSCTIARCATDMQARCNRCGELFLPAESAW